MDNAASTIPLSSRKGIDFSFRRFFEMKLDESASPFLNKTAQRVSRNLYLKTALCAAIFLMGSFLIQGINEPLATIFLYIVFFLVGTPCCIEAIEDVARWDVNLDVLMTAAAFAACFLGNSMEGALLLVLFALSGAIEESVNLKAKQSILHLHELAPTKAYVIRGPNTYFEKAVQDIQTGEHIFVAAGEVVPLDGKILQGAAQVSLAHLTGESLPELKKEQDFIPSGALVLDSGITLVVTHTSTESTVSKIVELVVKAEENKPRIATWFNKMSSFYAFSIILFSFFIAMSIPVFTKIPYFGPEGSIYRALAFLIAASPCALVLAVPIAYLSALGACARMGIILKGGVVIDRLNDCSTIAFDKTGTLTEGVLALEKIIPISATNTSHNTIVQLAAALEQHSNHPIARAIVHYAHKEQIIIPTLVNVRSLAGKGIEAKFDNNILFIGNSSEANIYINAEDVALVHSIQSEYALYGLVTALFVYGKESYLFVFNDTLRPHVAEMLTKLKQLGKKIIMLTGDHVQSAKYVAEKLHIESFKAHLTPEEKLHTIQELSKRDGLIMVGDGVNDAPALAYATVGISFGQSGSTLAQDKADILFLQDRIDLLDWILEKAKKTRYIVHENIILALAVIFGASIPALFGLVPLWLAVLLHEGGTVFVGLNGLRLLSIKKEKK